MYPLDRGGRLGGVEVFEPGGEWVRSTAGDLGVELDAQLIVAGDRRDHAQRSGRLQPVHVGERAHELGVGVGMALAERLAGGCGDLDHGADQAEERDRVLRRERITNRPHEGEVRAVVAGPG